MKIEQDRNRRAEEYYSKYTFEPSINKVSQMLGRKATTDELVGGSSSSSSSGSSTPCLSYEWHHESWTWRTYKPVAVVVVVVVAVAVVSLRLHQILSTGP